MYMHLIIVCLQLKHFISLYRIYEFPAAGLFLGFHSYILSLVGMRFCNLKSCCFILKKMDKMILIYIF